MGSTTIEYRTLPGTRAAMGRAGNHSVIADRPERKHGGMGLGFNGGELLALAIGGCFCNDMQALADEMGVEILDLAISVTIDFDGRPSRAGAARMYVQCSLADGSDPSALIDRAKALTTIGNSLTAGVPVSIEMGAPALDGGMAETPPDTDWRRERKSGMQVIAISIAISLALLYGFYRFLPPLNGMETIGARMLVALKCVAAATLFCFVAGIEAVAHERLQSPAFDPLAGFETKRLRVNLRYLQNTLEQLIVFAVGLFGLSAYLSSGATIRLIPAITIIWILNRFAFWIGYHRSAAMRGLGAPSMAVSLIMLLYVAARIGNDVAGTVGGAIAIAAYLMLEAVLFLKTR